MPQRSLRLRGKAVAGFTIIELLIVMVVGSILAISVVAMFVSQTRTMALNEDLVDLQQNLRISMDLLHRDVRMAGSYINGIFPPFVLGPIDYDDDGLPDFNSEGGGSNPDAIMLQYSTDAGQLIRTYNGAATNLQVCRPSGLVVGQVIAVSNPDSPPETRGIEVTLVGPVSCPGVGCPGDDCDKVNFSPGGSLHNSPGGLAADFEDGRLWDNMQTLTYFVTDDADDDGTADDPALMRVNGLSAAPAIVAFGITDLQIEYQDADGVPTTTLADIRRVGITVTGETRSAHQVGGAGGKRARSLSTELLVRNLRY